MSCRGKVTQNSKGVHDARLLVAPLDRDDFLAAADKLVVQSLSVALLKKRYKPLTDTRETEQLSDLRTKRLSICALQQSLDNLQVLRVSLTKHGSFFHGGSIEVRCALHGRMIYVISESGCQVSNDGSAYSISMKERRKRRYAVRGAQAAHHKQQSCMNQCTDGFQGKPSQRG